MAGARWIRVRLPLMQASTMSPRMSTSSSTGPSRPATASMEFCRFSSSERASTGRHSARRRTGSRLRSSPCSQAPEPRTVMPNDSVTGSACRRIRMSASLGMEPNEAARNSPFVSTWTAGVDARNRLATRNHFRGRSSAERPIASLHDFAEDEVASPAALRDERHTDAAVHREGRGLHHARLGTVEDILSRRAPGAVDATGHPIVGGSVLSKKKVEPAIPLKQVRAFRLVADVAGHEERRLGSPVARVRRGEQFQRAAAAGDRGLGEFGCRQHSIAAIRMPEYERIAIRSTAVGRLRLGEGRGQHLREVDAVGAGGHSEALTAVRHTCGVEGVPGVLVAEDGPRADGRLPLLGDGESQGVLLPIAQVRGGHVRPLVSAESPFAAVVAAIKEIVDVKTAVVEERHRIAGGGVVAARFPELSDRPLGPEDLEFPV